MCQAHRQYSFCQLCPASATCACQAAWSSASRALISACMAPASSEALVLEADFVGLTAVAIASLRVVEATAPTSAAATSPCITGMYDAARPAGAVWFVTCAHGCSTPHVFAVRLLYFAGRPTGADPCSAHHCASRRLTRPERRGQCYRQHLKMSPAASLRRGDALALLDAPRLQRRPLAPFTSAV